MRLRLPPPLFPSFWKKDIVKKEVNFSPPQNPRSFRPKNHGPSWVSPAPRIICAVAKNADYRFLCIKPPVLLGMLADDNPGLLPVGQVLDFHYPPGKILELACRKKFGGTVQKNHPHHAQHPCSWWEEGINRRICPNL